MKDLLESPEHVQDCWEELQPRLESQILISFCREILRKRSKNLCSQRVYWMEKSNVGNHYVSQQLEKHLERSPRVSELVQDCWENLQLHLVMFIELGNDIPIFQFHELFLKSL